MTDPMDDPRASRGEPRHDRVDVPCRVTRCPFLPIERILQLCGEHLLALYAGELADTDIEENLNEIGREP